ncbi:MAG: trypsin-like serine protease [Planctomycetes bacterium]|nr:trypsin-like serine protease [Planctomycetota bacterium]
MIVSIYSFMLAVGQKDARAGFMLPGNDPNHIAIGSNFEFVGWVEGTNSSNQTAFRQSISLIDPEWGLATVHGFLENDADPNSRYTNIRVGFGSNYFNNPGEFQYAAEVIFHPTKDLALVRFDNPFTTITPVQRYLGDVQVGDEGYLVGYGNRQYVNDPIATFTGDRRGGFDVVENSIFTDRFRTRFNESFESGYRVFEMGGRNGDSGGAFIYNNLLSGVIDSASLSNTFGASTFINRLDNTWIDSHVTSVPEPSSFLLITIASGTLFRFRRRFIK